MVNQYKSKIFIQYPDYTIICKLIFALINCPEADLRVKATPFKTVKLMQKITKFGGDEGI